MKPYIVRVVSLKRKIGKTSVGTSLIKELILRGVKVAAIKHTHSGLDTGKDTARYLSSGVDVVIAVGPSWSALYLRNAYTSLSDAINLLPGAYSIVIAEGFKRSDIGDVLAIVSDLNELSELRNHVSGNIVAIVTYSLNENKISDDYGIRVFKHNDIHELAEFIIERAIRFISSQTPGLDCGHCGYSTCIEFSKAYLLGKVAECPVASEVKLIINGREVALSPFVKMALKNTVLGFVTSLKNVPKDPSKIKELKLTLK